MTLTYGYGHDLRTSHLSPKIYFFLGRGIPSSGIAAGSSYGACNETTERVATGKASGVKLCQNTHMMTQHRKNILARTSPSTRSALLLAHPGRSDKSAKGVELRIGTVNIGTLRGRNGEVVEMVGRRRLDFCCLQETRWKGEGARILLLLSVCIACPATEQRLVQPCVEPRVRR